MKTETLMNSVDMLDAIKNKYLCTDYRAAKLLGISTQAVSNIRCDRKTFGDETALKAAQLLDMNPAFLLACLQAERADRGEHPALAGAWRRAAASISTAAVFALFFSVLAPSPAHAAGSSASDSVYYVKHHKHLFRMLFRVFRRLLRLTIIPLRHPPTWPIPAV